MNKLRRVGLETGQLTDEELRTIDGEIIEAAHPALHARGYSRQNLFPTQGSGASAASRRQIWAPPS